MRREGVADHKSSKLIENKLHAYLADQWRLNFFSHDKGKPHNYIHILLSILQCRNRVKGGKRKGSIEGGREGGGIRERRGSDVHGNVDRERGVGESRKGWIGEIDEGTEEEKGD